MDFVLIDREFKTVSASVVVNGLKKINIGTVAIVNHSFEDPALGDATTVVKTKCFNDNVPGWSSDGGCSDSGVANASNGLTEGRQRAFLFSKDVTPNNDFNSLYQMTNYVIVGREKVTLTYDVKNLSGAYNYTMRLYYLDGGVRTELASHVYDATPPNGQQRIDETVVLDAADIPKAAIGKTIGIELIFQVKATNGWVALDNVRMEVTE